MKSQASLMHPGDSISIQAPFDLSNVLMCAVQCDFGCACNSKDVAVLLLLM